MEVQDQSEMVILLVVLQAQDAEIVTGALKNMALPVLSYPAREPSSVEKTSHCSSRFKLPT